MKNSKKKSYLAVVEQVFFNNVLIIYFSFLFSKCHQFPAETSNCGRKICKTNSGVIVSLEIPPIPKISKETQM
jgi:hypothetical protein